MYPEEELPPVEPSDYFPRGGIGGKFKYHLEGLVPLILVLIIGVVLAVKFGLIAMPFQESSLNLLIVGLPSHSTKQVLDQSNDFVKYRTMDPELLVRGASSLLSEYDAVLLDQSQLADKSITFSLGDALTEYVKKGGTLVVVANSGIYLRDRAGNIDPSVIGWEALLGDVMPVNCLPNITMEPSCITPISIYGRIYPTGASEDHPIMQGVLAYPAKEFPPQPFYLLNVNLEESANEIAYIENIDTGASYPGIIEQRRFVGKVIYFNYDPGMSPPLFLNTLRYLAGK